MRVASNQFVLAFTIEGLLLALLAIAGIVCLIFLAKVLMQLSQTTKELNALVKGNAKELDKTIKALPGLMTKVDTSLVEANVALKEVNHLLVESSPALLSTIDSVSVSAQNASKLTANVNDTVEYFAVSAIDTADSLTSKVSSAGATFSYVKEVVDIIRNFIQKK